MCNRRSTYHCFWWLALANLFFFSQAASPTSRGYVDSFVNGACNESCQADQRSALQSLYSSLQGQNWLSQDGWTLSPAANPQDYCSWSGVACCRSNLTYYSSGYTSACYISNAVVALYLPSNQLQGTWPAAAKASLFKTLEYFNAAGMQLHHSFS